MTKEEQEKKALTFEYLQKIDFILKKIRLEEKGMFETVSSQKRPDITGKLIVTKVDFPNSGGILTCFENFPPMKGYPDGDTVERVDEAKKMVMRGLWGFYLMPRYLFPFLLPLLPVIIENSIISYWEYIKKYRFKPERYCRTARELYKVFLVLGQFKKEKDREIWEMIRDDVCLTMEGDDAYRYRVQLILPELNKSALQKNPVKELKRLIKLLSDREENVGMKQKWQMASRYLFLLKFKKKVFNALINFLLMLDLNEIKMDADDLEHAKTKVAFNWGE